MKLYTLSSAVVLSLLITNTSVFAMDVPDSDPSKSITTQAQQPGMPGLVESVAVHKSVAGLTAESNSDDDNSYLRVLPRDVVPQLFLCLEGYPEHREILCETTGVESTDHPSYWAAKCRLRLDQFRADPYYSWGQKFLQSTVVPRDFMYNYDNYGFLNHFYSLPKSTRDELWSNIQRQFSAEISSLDASYLSIWNEINSAQRLIYSAYITLPPEDHQNLIVSATLRLDNQKLRAIALASPLLFSTPMSSYGRAAIITACVPLTVPQIEAIAHASPFLFSTTKNNPLLYSIPMSGYDRAAIIRACVPLTPDEIATVAQTHPLLFTPTMSALMRRITIQGLRFVKITDPVQKTRIMEQPYNKRLLQGVQPDLNLELITTPGLPYPSGWTLKEDFETVAFSRSSDGETKIIAPKCTFSRPLPEEIKGVPLVFEAEVKAPFPVSGGYSDKLTSKYWVTTKGTNEWETIRLPFTVQDGESSQLYALRFTTPPGEEQTFTIRKLKIVLGDPAPSLMSVAASSN